MLHFIKSEDDIKWLEDKSHSNTLYTGMVTPEMFTYDTLRRFESAKIFSGVILISPKDSVLPSRGFSSDQKCPNAPSVGYTANQCDESEKAWNPQGSDIGVHDWPFPIIYVTDSNVTRDLMDDCYEKYNKPKQDGAPRDWPLCAVELDSFMNQAVSTDVCVRRQKWSNPFSPSRWCDPLGDQSVFMMLTAPKAASQAESESDDAFYPDDSVVLVTARLDTMGMFDRLQIGSESPVTGIVTLLAVAKLLADFRKPGGTLVYAAGVENVLFAFLNGESYDFIGSSKMAYDMMTSQFPCVTSSGRSSDESCEKVLKMEGRKWRKIRPSSVRNHLELGQLYSQESNNLFVHVDADFSREDLVENLIKDMDRLNVKVQRSSDKSRGLPPASAANWAKLTKLSTPAMLLTNFDQAINNKYYHSVFDSYINSGVYNSSLGDQQDLVTELCRVAEGIATHVFYQATQQKTVFEMDPSVMKEMLDCFLNSSRCGLFARASTPELPPQEGIGPVGPYPQYVQVATSFQMHSFLVQRVLSYLTGEEVSEVKAKDNCTAAADQNVYRYFWHRGEHESPNCTVHVNGTHTPEGSEVCGVCKRTTSWLSVAQSPAFMIENYDFRNNRTYASWSESQWSLFSGRIFLKGSPALEQGYLGAGITVFLLSLLLVYWANKFSDDIFPGTLAPTERPLAEGPGTGADGAVMNHDLPSQARRRQLQPERDAVTT